jgi:lipopolysaccharide exporter
MRTWAYIAVFIPTMLLAGSRWGAEGVAAARMAVTVLFVPIMFYSAMLVIPVTASEIALRIWRPSVAALAMTAAVKLGGADAISSVGLRLLCDVTVGAVMFTMVLFALWALAGRPDGAERILTRQLASAWIWTKVRFRMPA